MLFGIWVRDVWEFESGADDGIEFCFEVIDIKEFEVFGIRMVDIVEFGGRLVSVKLFGRGWGDVVDILG